MYILPLRNIYLTHLFSKVRLKRKDFPEVARLAWAQEAPGSNPGAPTNLFLSLRASRKALPRTMGKFGGLAVPSLFSTSCICSARYFS